MSVPTADPSTPSTPRPSPASSCACAAATTSRDASRLGTLEAPLPERAVRLQRAMAAIGHPITITQAKRTAAEQAALYAQGRTTPGKRVTDADGIERLSNHQSGRAFDVAFLTEAGPSWDEGHPWAALGALGEVLGLKWGGRWRTPDRPHFELPRTSVRGLLGLPTSEDGAC